MVVSSMSTLSVFADLATKYSSWDEFKAWLQTAEPEIDLIETEGSPYVILRNSRDRDVDESNETSAEETKAADTPTTELRQVCRSVVWDTRSNRPCCVAPFAARRDQKIPTGVALNVEDFVEGVMINVFRCRDDSEVRVSTRSRIDANGKFYSEKSFRELFDEALDAKDSSLDDIAGMIGEPTDDVQATFMTLVLAHPEHRVVRTVEKANLWAIYRGVVLNDGTVEFITADLPSSWKPKVYSSDFVPANWAQMKAKFDEVRGSKPWYWQGIVVHNGLQRWRFRNGDHDRVRRDLRGTESNPLGRFLRLRSQKRVQEYLRIYAEDNDAFQGFERNYRNATKTIYTWYCRCHKDHSVTFKNLPKSVQPLVFEMHKYYLATLRPNQKSLHLVDVIAWITDYLKAQYSISNMLRFMKEVEQPPVSNTPWPKDVASAEVAAEVAPAEVAESSSALQDGESV
jgi:hypothetical protein